MRIQIRKAGIQNRILDGQENTSKMILKIGGRNSSKFDELDDHFLGQTEDFLIVLMHGEAPFDGSSRKKASAGWKEGLKVEAEALFGLLKYPIRHSETMGTLTYLLWVLQGGDGMSAFVNMNSGEGSNA